MLSAQRRPYSQRAVLLDAEAADLYVDPLREASLVFWVCVWIGERLPGFREQLDAMLTSLEVSLSQQLGSTQFS